MNEHSYDNPLYRTWRQIRKRCSNPNSANYKWYGGKGVSVCSRWDDFDVFVDDVGPHPGPGWTIDRISNDGDYEPGNVQWATMDEQNRKRSNTKLDLEKVNKIKELYATRSYRLVDLAEMFGCGKSQISYIVRGERWK